MPETPEPNTPSLQEVQSRLRAVVQLLRASNSFDANTKHILAELVEELNAALKADSVPPAEVSRLAESTAQLAELLHKQQDRGILSKSKDRLEGALLEAEAHAPLAVGLARRLLDALANIGI